MSNTTRKLAAIVSLLLLVIQVSILPSCLAGEAISKTQQLSDGQTLVSEGGTFELGFFFAPNSTLNRYIGIWYRRVPVDRAVWVANRDNPLKDRTGVLMIGRDGNLELVDGRSNTIWSTGLVSASNDTVAVLRNTGNLVLSENRSNGSILWESFHHPSDTLLPTMKFGENTRTRDRISFTSWRTDNDPSPGSLVLFLDPQQLPEVVILNGTIKRWRSGQWNGRSFIGIPDMDTNYVTGFTLARDDEAGTIYLVYASYRASSSSSIFLSPMGDLTKVFWNTEREEWVKSVVAPQVPCDIYGTCGPFGMCNNVNMPVCRCLRGFEPKSPEDWSRGNWTHGCARRVELQCENNSSKADQFFKLGRTKLPELSDSINAVDRRECEEFCLKNCSCTGYAFVNGFGCIVWWGQMMDVQEFSHGGEELYLRLAHSELGTYFVVSLKSF